MFTGRHSIDLGKAPKRIAADVGQTTLGGHQVVVAVPSTFMNESGAAVQPIARYFSVEPERMVVIHDDIDTPFGKIKLQNGRGTGGHNGVASIARRMGGSEFWRVKVGVGRPPGRQDPADYVLRRFTPEERPDADYLIQVAADVTELLITDGPDAARQLAGTSKI